MAINGIFLKKLPAALNQSYFTGGNLPAVQNQLYFTEKKFPCDAKSIVFYCGLLDFHHFST